MKPRYQNTFDKRINRSCPMVGVLLFLDVVVTLSYLYADGHEYSSKKSASVYIHSKERANVFVAAFGKTVRTQLGTI